MRRFSQSEVTLKLITASQQLITMFLPDLQQLATQVTKRLKLLSEMQVWELSQTTL